MKEEEKKRENVNLFAKFNLFVKLRKMK